MRCYLFDIDGTIADLTQRLHHIKKSPPDWDAFFADCQDDKPIRHIWELLNDLYGVGVIIVYVSGRSDRVRQETEDWISTHNFPGVGGRNALYMRKDGDHRPDHIVKGELLDRLLADGYEPIMAFDDRNQVVEMWRSRGIPCAQVADGNF
jgi:phosphoglycolate phosphatase-like HAD superfamily hydrolase